MQENRDKPPYRGHKLPYRVRGLTSRPPMPTTVSMGETQISPAPDPSLVSRGSRWTHGMNVAS
eukprot:3797182-Lingulodinium_polyedra.AAC.1